MNNPLTKIDFYKADHRRQYPEGTTMVYSNFTPRKSRIKGIEHVVFFGLQYVILQFLIGEWRRNFFNRPKEIVITQYKRRMDNALGKDAIPTDHLEALHDLGYLPLEIKALPEGTLVPIKVPVFTIRNTKDEFFWLVNYLETALSNKVWKPITSATLAFNFRKTFEEYYRQTVDETGNGSAQVMWQGHDFSYRGMSGDEDACTSAAGHLLSFYGTDTVPAIDFLEDYYFADSDKEIIGGSVPATEHSVMCMGSEDGEFETFKHLITELYPSGIVSIVSDTWDYWQVIDNYLLRLKEEILSRTGSPLGLDRVVIRPDSGDPYRIICGYFPEEVVEIDGELFVPEHGIWVTQSEVEGSIERLWSTFGGTTTAQGYRQLNPKIGLIYGDSINLDNQVRILEGLKRKGFASTNVVLGIGSYTYEYQTRDTFGFAMKATYGEVIEQYYELYHPDTESDAGELVTRKVGKEIFKNPKTDNGMKKSAKGLLCVLEDDEHNIILKDQCSWKEERQGLLETVFLNGKLTKVQNLSEIRAKVNSYL